MTYTDRYPSGRPYTACGAPHPSPESIYRRCSREVDAEGKHIGDRPERHINRLGNEWESPPMRTYRITHTYEIEMRNDQEAQQLGNDTAKGIAVTLAAWDDQGSWYPTITVEEIELTKCRELHGDENEVIECWQERAREARPIALLQD